MNKANKTFALLTAVLALSIAINIYLGMQKIDEKSQTWVDSSRPTNRLPTPVIEQFLTLVLKHWYQSSSHEANEAEIRPLLTEAVFADFQQMSKDRERIQKFLMKSISRSEAGVFFVRGDLYFKFRAEPVPIELQIQLGVTNISTVNRFGLNVQSLQPQLSEPEWIHTVYLRPLHESTLEFPCPRISAPLGLNQKAVQWAIATNRLTLTIVEPWTEELKTLSPTVTVECETKKYQLQLRAATNASENHQLLVGWLRAEQGVQRSLTGEEQQQAFLRAKIKSQLEDQLGIKWLEPKAQPEKGK